MRIVAGRLGGRKIKPPAHMPARPTTERARESLFNILAHQLDFDNLRALELFAGTGAISFELASRCPAAVITAVEQHAALAAFIKSTAALLGVASQITVLRADALKFIAGATVAWDFIFADPPYALPQMAALPDMVCNNGLLCPGGLFVLEHGRQHSFQQHPYFTEERMYGEAVFSFFRQRN